MNGRKWLLLATVRAAATTAFVVELTTSANPMTVLKRVTAVFIVYVVSLGLNWVGMAWMVAVVGVTRGGLRRDDPDVRSMVARAMESRPFWIAFWFSFAMLIVNTLVPLLLLGSLPLWTVLAISALNVVTNLGAVPLRKWLWGIHKEAALA